MYRCSLLYMDVNLMKIWRKIIRPRPVAHQGIVLPRAVSVLIFIEVQKR